MGPTLTMSFHGARRVFYLTFGFNLSCDWWWGDLCRLFSDVVLSNMRATMSHGICLKSIAAKLRINPTESIKLIDLIRNYWFDLILIK